MLLLSHGHVTAVVLADANEAAATAEAPAVATTTAAAAAAAATELLPPAQVP
jgi:hypothetical protein